jgi:hypothetical protein
LYFHCKEQSRNNADRFLQPAVCMAMLASADPLVDVIARPRFPELGQAVGRIPAFAVMKRHGLSLSDLAGKHARARLACAQQKTRCGLRPGGSPSFGEYSFLEDSRYTSQEGWWGDLISRKNIRSFWGLPPFHDSQSARSHPF